MHKLLGRPPRGGRGLKYHDLAQFLAILGVAPPRGGRGLKFQALVQVRDAVGVAPLAGAWIEMILLQMEH